MEYGLIGKKLAHSHSPWIHKHLFGYDYELKELNETELDDFFSARRFKGINVTIPYKEKALDYCDSLSDSALKIGSVNTIIKRADGSLYGCNTDYCGLEYLAERTGISFEGQKVLILGSGGTAKTVRALAADKGAARIITVSRSGKVNYNNLLDYSDSDIIINATPVGMYPNNDESLIDLNDFPCCHGVLDVIYNPLRTNLILQASANGILCSGGLPMLVAQARYAGELFSGLKPDSYKTEETLASLEKRLTNIVFIGMPGSGKSTLGSVTAADFKREFYDTDEYISRQNGRSIPQIFSESGEQYFRSLEAEAVKQLSKLQGIVLSTGGGVPLSEKNVRLLKQNGFIVWLKRDIEQLPTQGRPLSGDTAAMHEMFRLRMPFYKSASDSVIDNNSSLGDASVKITEAFYSSFQSSPDI